MGRQGRTTVVPRRCVRTGHAIAPAASGAAAPGARRPGAGSRRRGLLRGGRARLSADCVPVRPDDRADGRRRLSGAALVRPQHSPAARVIAGTARRRRRRRAAASGRLRAPRPERRQRNGSPRRRRRAPGPRAGSRDRRSDAAVWPGYARVHVARSRGAQAADCCRRRVCDRRARAAAADGDRSASPDVCGAARSARPVGVSRRWCGPTAARADGQVRRRARASTAAARRCARRACRRPGRPWRRPRIGPTLAPVSRHWRCRPPRP